MNKRTFLDRIDLHVEVPLVDFKELSQGASGEKSDAIRERVLAAKQIQLERFKKASNTTNAGMGSRQVRQHCALDAKGSGYWSMPWR